MIKYLTFSDINIIYRQTDVKGIRRSFPANNRPYISQNIDFGGIVFS